MEARIGQARCSVVVCSGDAVNNGNQSSLIWQVVFGVVVLEAVGIADIRRGHDGLGTERVLNANAPLVAEGQFVVGAVQARDASRVDWQSTRRASGQREPGIVEFDRPWCIHLQTERNVRAGIVHVVALNPFVHHSESAADYGLAGASEVVSEAEARTERRPVVVHKTLGYAVLPGNADSIKVQGNSRENRVRAGAQSRAGGVNCPVWIEQRGIGRIVE